MIINNNESPDVSRLNQTTVDRAPGSSRAAGAGASQLAGTDGTSGNDSISLSNSPNLVQQALTVSSPERSARTQQLKALVQNNQYQPDVKEVSLALIAAHITEA
jgi:hypothetical protein